MRDWHNKPWSGYDTELALFVTTLVLAPLLMNRVADRRTGRGALVAAISLMVSVAVFAATQDFRINLVAQSVLILGFLAVTKHA